MSVIQRMGMVPTDKDDKPRNPITIHKARAYKGVPPDDDEDDEFAYANRNVLAASLGISSGVMIYVSFVEVFFKSISSFKDAGHDEDRAYVYATVCFFAGVIILIVSFLLQ